MNKYNSLKSLFIIDGVGAILSMFFLGVVLVRLNEIVGMPVNTLYILAAIPIAFLLYDIIALFQHPDKQQSLLRGIAVLNSIYCIISLTFLFLHHHDLTMWGWVYFILEIIVLVILVGIELKAANRV